MLVCFKIRLNKNALILTKGQVYIENKRLRESFGSMIG